MGAKDAIKKVFVDTVTAASQIKTSKSTRIKKREI
jgi:hypothetical protein